MVVDSQRPCGRWVSLGGLHLPKGRHHGAVVGELEASKWPGQMVFELGGEALGVAGVDAEHQLHGHNHFRPDEGLGLSDGPSHAPGPASCGRPGRGRGCGRYGRNLLDLGELEQRQLAAGRRGGHQGSAPAVAGVGDEVVDHRVEVTTTGTVHRQLAIGAGAVGEHGVEVVDLAPQIELVDHVVDELAQLVD